ncbi:MAG: CHASE domain-containing protein [Rhodospirillales bacterium]
MLSPDGPEAHSEESHAARNLWSIAAIAAVSLFGIALSIGAYYTLKVREDVRLHEIFVGDAQDQAQVIKSTIDGRIIQLQALQGFLNYSETVTRQEFRDFTGVFLSEKSSFRTLEWVPVVRRHEREAFVRKVRAESFTDFEIRGIDSNGALVRAGERNQYFPVLYAEPIAENKRAIGFDAGATPDRRRILDLARASGRLTVSGRLKLVQEKEGLFSVILYLPVYWSAMPQQTIAQRRKALRGFAVAIVRLGNVVEAALGRRKTKNLNVQLIDETAPPQERLLYTHYSTQSRGFKDIDDIRYDAAWQSAFGVGDRRWSILVQAVHPYFPLRRSWLPMGSLIIGLLITATVAGYFALSWRRIRERDGLLARVVAVNQSLEREIEDRKAAQQGLFKLLESVPDAVIVVSGSGRILRVNKQFESLFGHNRIDVLGKPVDMLMPARYRENHTRLMKDFFASMTTRMVGSGLGVYALGANGREFPVEISLSPVEMGDDLMVGAFIREIGRKA